MDGSAPLRSMSTGAAGSNKSPPLPVTIELETNAVDSSIIVEARLSHVYRRCLRIEEYSQFIHAIKSVRKLDASHFAMQGKFDGEPFDAVLEIMLRVPDRRVAWRLLHDHLTAGVVSLVSLSHNRTQVNLKMMSSFGGVLADRIDSYLQEFKTLIERE
jgi:uncharacterized membrane protein